MFIIYHVVEGEGGIWFTLHPFCNHDWPDAAPSSCVWLVPGTYEED